MSLAELWGKLEEARSLSLAWALGRGRSKRLLARSLEEIATLETLLEARLQEARSQEEKREIEEMLKRVRELRRSVVLAKLMARR